MHCLETNQNINLGKNNCPRHIKLVRSFKIIIGQVSAQGQFAQKEPVAPWDK